jgi:hypothetical protein
VHQFPVFSRVLLATLRQQKIAHLMVENHHLLRPGRFLQQPLDLGIVRPLHFLLIVKVVNSALLMRQLEALPVQRQLIDDLARCESAPGAARTAR